MSTNQQFKPNLFQQKTFFQGYLSSALLKDIHNTLGVLYYQQRSNEQDNYNQSENEKKLSQNKQIPYQIQDFDLNENDQIYNEYKEIGLAIAIGPQYLLCNIDNILINDQIVQEDRLLFRCQNREYRVKQILYQQEEYVSNTDADILEQKTEDKIFSCDYAVLIIEREIQEYVGVLQIENSFYFLQDYDQYNENKCLYVLSNTFLLERYVQDIQQNTVYIEQINQLEQICPVYIHMDSNQTSSPLLIGFYKNVNKFKQGIIQLFDSNTFLQILSWVQGYQSIAYTSKYTQETQYPYQNDKYLTKETLQKSIEERDKKLNVELKQNLYKQGCVWKLQRLNHRVMCSSSGDFKLKIWDTTTNTLVRVLDLGNNICRDLVCFNDILICACDNVLQIFNWETGQIIQKLTFKDKIQCLGQFELHKDVIATGHQNGYIHILKFSKRKSQWQAIQVIKNNQHEEHGHESFVNSIVGLNNYEMASAGTNGQIKIWNWQSGEFVKELQAHLPNKSVYFMKYLADRDTLISGGSDKSIRIWDLKNNQFKEFSFKNPLYTVELITSRYLCVGDGQDVIIYDINMNISTVIYSTTSRVNSIIKLNPNCLAVGDTDGQILLFKYSFNQSINECYQFNPNAFNSQSSNKEENTISRSPSKNVAETFCQNEKSGIKSQYQTESHPISSLASPLEYNTKQSQPPSNQNQDSSLLVQVNNQNANNDLNLLLSNRSNLKKSETLSNQFKKYQTISQNLKDQFVNQSSQLTTSRNENNKQSIQENPLNSNFGQLSSNFTLQGSSNNNFITQQLQDQQCEINENRQTLINEQNVFRLKLEDRDEQLKKVHQKYAKLFEQIFIILENYEANKLVLQHLKKDFESINQDLRKYFTNMDLIYIKQVKNLESIMQNKDKEQQIQMKTIQDALQNKQIQLEELQKSFDNQKMIIESQVEDSLKKNAYIDLLSKQINEKDNMILDSQDRIKELMQLINGLQNRMSGKTITKITTPSKETPLKIQQFNQQSRKDSQIEKENSSSFLTDKVIYSYRNQSKFQSSENHQTTSEPKIPTIVNSTKLLKNAQYPQKGNLNQVDKILEQSQIEKSITNSNNSNMTEKILQTNLILNTPIKKDQFDKHLKTDNNLTNSIKLTSTEFDQQDIYESLSYKLNNNISKNSQGVIRSKSYSKPSTYLQNSQTSTNINQENSTFRIIHSKNATPDIKEKSLSTFESIQKPILQNNTSIINQTANTQISPIKSQFSPMSKTNGQIVIKIPQPTQVCTQSREDLIKIVNDPQPPSLQQILQTASDIENMNSKQPFETNKNIQFQSNQNILDTQLSKENYETIFSYISKENQQSKKQLNQIQSFESNQQIINKQLPKQEKLNQFSDQISEKVIASKVGNITIQSRIVRSTSQKPHQIQQ
ncbi:WD domain, G-beta repeat protein (macronuclear) [Tetrahymena thermophila SB210]|uniref:WD domain, G-beta repeat protein n=1 Tax=Tetrahymena thermophila (strain SB210) TaxID=312017 RepID=I7M3T7_TETTS|nr:WD domain, G-beta repeat protein [Tetrahymena thermophila SB210]EAS04277.2 WD domain, G-beta repeat protein [Tetrahymena thermophila SB210]|eukprot:XP_001024522.2 WD domain, G-beta repeat protein [Tetrahymena thermophila SB210]